MILLNVSFVQHLCSPFFLTNKSVLMILSEVSDEGFQIPATITERYKVGRTIGDGNFAVVKECVERWERYYLHQTLKETLGIVFSKTVCMCSLWHIWSKLKSQPQMQKKKKGRKKERKESLSNSRFEKCSDLRVWSIN